jgi:prepilin-type N-terminal cleavage/methylation domain-containing protein
MVLLHNYAKNMKNKKGFSLIELLIVIGILAILGAIMAPIGAGLLSRNNLRTKTDEVIISLQAARVNSMSGKEDSPWGVSIGANQIILFKGTSFAARDQAFDEVFGYPSSLTITNSEVVFDLVTGLPSSSTTINLNGPGSLSEVVIVNSNGAVDVQ